MVFGMTQLCMAFFLGSYGSGFISPKPCLNVRTLQTQLRDTQVNVGILDIPIDVENPFLQEKILPRQENIKDSGDDLESSQKENSSNIANKDSQEKHFAHAYLIEINKFIELYKEVIKNNKIAKEDKLFLKERIQNNEFLSKVQNFLTNSHGTHVAGIVAEDNENVKLIDLDFLPFDKKLIKEKQIVTLPLHHMGMKETVLIRNLISKIAKDCRKVYRNLATYLELNNIHIVNGSFSLPVQGFITNILLANRIDPNNFNFKELCEYYAERSNKLISNELAKCSNTLFVFSAGNERLNNDENAHIPANINQIITNSISVAAVDENMEIANFSNFGKRTVDIAAIGVDIVSTAPGGLKIKMSGTSQSAPLVTRAASKLKSKMTELTPEQIKEILLNTVDKYDHLKELISSGGVLNEKRALVALDIYMNQNKNEKNLVDACTQSYQEVKGKIYIPSWIKKFIIDEDK